MTASPAPGLTDETVELILTRLDLCARPEPTLEGLRTLYAAWCQRVPFDNVRKMIHVRESNPAPLPGSTADDYFSAWLLHGTGGTCWAGSGALQALLTRLGFKAERGIATMLVAPELPPNHGTVRVTFDEGTWLVDTSMLHGEPISLNTEPVMVSHAAWGLTGSTRDGRLHLNWRPLHKLDGFECRFERYGAEASEFHQLYEQTRAWSPFNYEVTTRINRGDEVIGLVQGLAVRLHSDGSVSREPVTRQERQRMMVEEMGFSEEIAAQLPEDLPTPPPPGSETARRRK